jgi:hypothetical protein
MSAFVVMGSAGDYESQTTWPVKILLCTEKQAGEWIDRCRAQALAKWQEHVDFEEKWLADELPEDDERPVDMTDECWNATEMDPEAINYFNEPAQYHVKVVEVEQL